MASSSKTITVSDKEEGDLIEFYRAYGTHSHWAVYIGEGKVIHLSADPDTKGTFDFDNILSSTSVRMDDIKQVAGDSYTYKNNTLDEELRPFGKREIVKRAKERLGQGGYTLATYNCEHFATECRYGQAISKQVKTIETFAPLVLRAYEERDWTVLKNPIISYISSRTSRVLVTL